jgi:hypothetical protein
MCAFVCSFFVLHARQPSILITYNSRNSRIASLMAVILENSRFFLLRDGIQ